MKAAVILSFVAAAVAGVLEARGCNADNCARAVTGTRAGKLDATSRQADCSSFQATTVVPDAVTKTITITVDPEDTAAPKSKRDLEYRAATNSPTAVPAYATACDQPARYASACSCWGITAVVTTAPTPTKTETVTVTQDYCEDL